jgi:hypothetical protein
LFGRAWQHAFGTPHDLVQPSLDLTINFPKGLPFKKAFPLKPPAFGLAASSSRWAIRVGADRNEFNLKMSQPPFHNTTHDGSQIVICRGLVHCEGAKTWPCPFCFCVSASDSWLLEEILSHLQPKHKNRRQSSFRKLRQSHAWP